MSLSCSMLVTFTRLKLSVPVNATQGYPYPTGSAIKVEILDADNNRPAILGIILGFLTQ